jgi:hypothetical protein
VRTTLRVFLILSIVTLAASAAADSPGAWRADGTENGMGVAKRSVRGSSFDEIRVTTTSALPLDQLCDAIYAKGLDGRSNVKFKRRELLRETPSERWTYEQIAVPWVSDRDYVMHTTLNQAAATGRCEVSFETQDDPSHPPARGVVRMPCIRGHWLVTPTGDGRFNVSYEIFSDPGGGVPAFLASGAQRSSAVDFVKIILERAKAPAVVTR